MADIQTDILIKLEKSCQQFPELFPKPVYVFAAVDGNVDGQCEQRLRQAKENQTGKRITLIPYNSGDLHWIGVLLEFKVNGQIERAEFIDPVKQSHFVLNKLQKQFANVYPDVILQSRNLQKHDDQEQSAILTVDNLIEAAKQAQSTDVKYTGMRPSSHQTFGDHNTSRPFTKEKRSLLTSAASQGNISEFRDSGQTSNNELDRLENQDAFDFLVKVQGTEHSIEQYENQNRDNNPNVKKESLKKLEELQNVKKQIYNREFNDTIYEKGDQIELESCEVLKEQLESRLREYDLSNKEELEEHIIEKKQVIQTLKKERKHNLAQKRQKSLSELEQLQVLVDKIEAIESSHSNDDYEILKNQLKERLVEHDINSKDELKQRIIDMKEIIQSLENEGRYNLVRKRKKSLSELEQLQVLADKIEAIESSHLNDDYERLKQQLEDGLAEYDMKSTEELKQRIIEKKQAIQSLTTKGQHNLVRRRQKSLSELEQLQLLADRIVAMTPSHPNIVDRKLEEQLNIDHQLEPPEMEEILDINIPIKEECLIAEENLKNLYKDFSSMPSCAERSIISLLFYVSLKLVDKTMILDDSIKVPDQIEIEMAKELECLEQRLKIEELESVQIHYLAQAVRVNIKNKNWKCALTVLRQFLKQLQPLNMQELFQLVEKVDDAAHLIKDKEIILFLGGTGSGKSTTIHFLSGSKMVEQTVAGLNHIAPTEIKNSELRSITTSPYTQSETRYITPVTVNFEDVGAYNNGSIVLCDSPGFEDTSGPEVDIANGIGIVKAIKGCKSVRPVVLISYKSIGDRCSGVKDLAHVLVGLIPGMKDHIKAFSYIFTKFPEKERNTIHNFLDDINKKLKDEEKSDASFTNFLNDMLQKTRRGARVLDPINDNPGEVLDELAEKAVILYPEEVFQFSITEKSRTIVQEQIRKNQLSIMSATKRFEYLFVQYKIDELKYLHDLLQQDYIEQIYNNCVRFISKHLADEYQEGILTLNRCLINQTVLNKGDIEQYQTRIDRANLAEDLREKHLGKEVIHSSAFIHYLNQQVDNIIEDLQEKDINDMSVKVSLDKIQFLSNSFLNLDCKKYQNVCQLFVEKFHYVIKSYKSSILSNQFDKSASDLTKLSDALTVLHNHLNNEGMKTKYIELKEYFLEYLKDSTGKITYLFSQEKLGRDDVDRLNMCVCMLESAKNTIAFQPHISQEEITEIYENLLSNILNYVEEIIKKINTQFKKDTSFHHLEQYMAQLDLIRTIAIIQLKTTQSYCRTLEKLVGYVHGLRRDVEEQLRILYQREGKVDYDKLTKCLSNLKSATWIEKYRSGVYSDVINNVEQQIVQHVKTLKESVMEVHLDLDHFDQIEHTYQIISEINQMKYVEKIVGDVIEHINAVNSWFTEVTNDVFVIIRETFNIEKCKEQEYQTIDFSKAEKAFCYLDACKKIRPLFKSDCVSVLHSLEEFFRDYNHFVEKEMASCFESITQYENKNKEEMFKKARILASRLHEISEIRSKYSRVYSCFINKKLIENWQNELSEYLTESSDEMEKLSATQRTESLSMKLLVVKALSKLDSFLSGEKYINVYYKYQSIFFLQTNDVCKRVIEAIKNTDYERVSFEMAALQASSDVGEHFSKQAKRALNVGLENLMEETKSQAIILGNNIEIEEIKSIVENLRRMQRAKQFVSQFLDTPDDIEKSITEVKKLIEGRIKRFLEGVEALITINNFYEAEKKIDSIILVRTLLGNYCTEDLSRQIETLRERQNDVVLKDVVDKYSNMDISGYPINPPTDIFAKFGEVNNRYPIYDEALNTIKERILAKFRKELDEAKLIRPPNPENIHIRMFECGVKFLPENMRMALEIELKHCKDDIVTLIRDNETNLEKAFSSGDLRSTKNAFDEYQKSEGTQSYVNKGREIVLKEMQGIALKIIQNFEKQEIREALENVKKLYDYKSELENVPIETRQSFLEVQSRIKTTFQEAYLCFTNRFLNTNIPFVTSEIVETVEKSFICLIEFMKFENECDGQPILTHMFPDDFNEKLIVLNDNILQYFTDRQKKYQTALDKLDVPSLKDSLDTAKQWNSLFLKMKSYDHIHSINDPSVNIIVQVITELTSYSQMLEAIAQKIEDLRDELINQELISSDSNELSQQRNEFYKKFNEKFLLLNKAKLFDAYSTNININKIEKECLESLERKLLEISSNAQSFAEKFSSDSKMARQDYDKFNLYYNNLISFKQEMKVQNFGVNRKIGKIEQIFFDKIRTSESVIENGTTIDITTCLIYMKRISNNIPSFKIRINERIDNILNNFKNAQASTTLAKLAAILNQDRTGIGQSIISEHKAFQGYSLYLFNEKAQRHGIDYVLDNLQGDFIDKNQLRERYDEFRTIYENLLGRYLKPYLELNRLIFDTKLITGYIKQKSKYIEWDRDIRSKIPKLAAHVFAVWTLQNAVHYFEATGVEGKDKYLFQPHAAQIISIFRMLGIGDKEEELKNNLVQIGTGEGKSVTLGVTACIFALLGFDVYCACYSEYLSQRDYTAFLSLFYSLDLLNYIHYGTFNKLCEDTINENGNIRHTIERFISNGSNNTIQNRQQIKRAKILLIDEVDVFFSRDFYGNVHTPSVSLRDPTITSLVNFIWTQRKSNLNLNQVKNTAEYNACCNRFPNWIALIQEAVKDMLFDVNNFESHDYVVNQDKIGSIEQDNIVYNVIYGYKTLFAYHCEHQKGKISKESLEENISIRIKCGSFSYAEILLEFNYIMGVTGTLQTLSDPEKRVIQNVYQINKNTYIPSVFGKNNLKFTKKDDIMIENSDDYFHVIRREIDDRLIGKSLKKRAVLVFFESKQKLKEFYNSKILEPIKESVICLTEEVSLIEKENFIKRATSSGQVTLFTRTFGRGTDFICYDQNVLANGGTHVIQTFFSEEVSEEIQIKGRTARQGDHGSYSMILLDRDLEKFHIGREHIEDVKNGKGIVVRFADKLTFNKIYDTVYDLLNDRRIDLFKTQYEANMKYVEVAKERHKSSQKFLLSLKSGDMYSVRKFLVEENKGVWSSRIVCLMDATSSMVDLLHECKNTVGIMFERASEILKDHNISSDSFQIQFVAYRNYNNQEDKILQSSSWETKPDNLRAFMNTIEAEGGLGKAAIEIGLWHANQENERENITQVILIGGGPPNSKNVISKKREQLGEKYWKTTKFAQPTYYEDELAKLIANKIPVHTFCVETRGEATFHNIARQTGGRCERLDISSSSGSQILTDLVIEEILRGVGDSSKGNILVGPYRHKFRKSYT